MKKNLILFYCIIFLLEIGNSQTLVSVKRGQSFMGLGDLQGPSLGFGLEHRIWKRLGLELGYSNSGLKGGNNYPFKSSSINLGWNYADQGVLLIKKSDIARNAILSSQLYFGSKLDLLSYRNYCNLSQITLSGKVYFIDNNKFKLGGAGMLGVVKMNLDYTFTEANFPLSDPESILDGSNVFLVTKLSTNALSVGAGYGIFSSLEVVEYLNLGVYGNYIQYIKGLQNVVNWGISLEYNFH
ncbi:MAG TPA: hypothetical protein PKD18_08080 [Saprospiraceae bacterium]|nr:hypothetical protein [Saprospiraceae bacterium]HOY11563.1 hypothetical protein [Saprospiraceae bacterium]HPN68278.1 hypothetical protein [Saprospiraceae bacterium]